MLELLRRDFQLAMVVFLSSCAIIAIAPFSVFRFRAGEYGIAALDAGIVVIMSGILFYALKTRKTYLASLLITSFYSVAAAVIVHLRPEATIYWLYPVFIANFFLLSITRASITNLLVLLAVLPTHNQFTTPFEFYVAAVTLLLVDAMAAIFSWKTQHQRRQLHELAMRDPLTGTFNRRNLTESANKAIARAQREKHTATLVIMDLDHFKTVNDRYGHEAGDRILCRVAERVTERIRVGSDTLFRYGGEEFVILLENTRLSDAIQLADQLRHEISQIKDTQVSTIKASFGCAELTADDDLDSWLGRADQALYRAKADGRNCVRAFENSSRVIA